MSTDHGKIASSLFEQLSMSADEKNQLMEFCHAALTVDTGLNVPAWASAVSAILSVKSAERQARDLKFVSWVLAVATVVLAAATIALLCKA